MYTVKELIEALQKCPEDYEVICSMMFGGIAFEIESVCIVHKSKTVELFDH